MSSTERLEEDLAFVRGAVQRRRDQRTPLGISLIWAFFAVVGFTGLDLDPDRAAWFLVVGSPIAFVLTWFIGSRAAWKLGEFDSAGGRRVFLHWGSFFVAFAAVLSMAFAGRLGGDPLGQVILIIVGLVYCLAGVHLGARLFGWLGLVMIMGAVALTYVDRWGWTTLGVLLAAGLIASSFIGGRCHD